MGSRPAETDALNFGRRLVGLVGGVALNAAVVLVAWDWTRSLSPEEWRSLPRIAALEHPVTAAPDASGSPPSPVQGLELFRVLEGTADPAVWNQARALVPDPNDGGLVTPAALSGRTISDVAAIPPRSRPARPVN